MSYNFFGWLDSAGILTPDNLALVNAATARLPNHRDMEVALARLHKGEILTEENRIVIRAHRHPRLFASALVHLHERKILTPDNQALVAIHASPLDLACALSSLHYHQIFTTNTRDKLALHANPTSLMEAIIGLNHAEILTYGNLAVVCDSNDPSALRSILLILHRCTILSDENRDTLVLLNHASLVSREAIRLIWEQIPEQLITQENFARLLAAAEHPQPMMGLLQIRDQILAAQAEPAPAVAGFNPGQSTHTASVHETVSASAARLMRSYGRDLKLTDKVKEIKSYVKRLAVLAPSPVHEAARTCIKRITKDNYSFIDTSGVSTLQLLVLAYTAIHDETKRVGSLADALKLFVESLYEIQRGYSLNAQGQDQGGDDRPICKAGTFNNLMEKLQGIHPDVEVYYITHEGASAKFLRLAKVHALAYLQELSLPKNAAEYLRIKYLLDDLKKENSLELIWKNIKTSVDDELWDEFKSSYGQNRSHPLRLLITLPLPRLPTVLRLMLGWWWSCLARRRVLGLPMRLLMVP